MQDKPYRIAIDVGGTFTDGVMVNRRTGAIELAKVSTTSTDPSVGFLECIQRLLHASGATSMEVDSIIHGTTVATNAIFEMKLARTGLITNEGFTDILEIGRMDRPKLYDLLQQRPRPLVPGRWRRGVRCRVDEEGNVLQDIVMADVEAAIEVFERDGIEAIAVCFLHSYKNPVHEVEVKQALLQRCPEIPVCCSYEVVPLHGETARTSTTVINAGLVPIVGRYLAGVEGRLHRMGFEGKLYILQSNGGTISSREAAKYPAWMIESGPAAGVIGASHLGRHLGIDNLISFDMGGTTAKVGLVRDGHPEIITEIEVGSMVRAKTYETGGGYPLKVPAIDLAEVGAGGGSVGWIDPGGGLRVGPRSAGADPGPASYGLGGEEPTVTDANLVAGKLNPDRFLGGEMPLRIDLARKAIDHVLCQHLGKEMEYCAQGIIEIADASMERTMKVVSTMRGYDLREYTVVAFGGSGPVHIASIARELGISKIVVPPSPGVFSCFGLLWADVKHDYTQAQMERHDRIDVRRAQLSYERMEKEAVTTLQGEGVPSDGIRLTRSADLRYEGQLFAIAVPAPSGPVDDVWVRDVVSDFHETHRRLYGHAAPEEPVELVALRLTAEGSLTRPAFREVERGSLECDAAIVGSRAVLYPGSLSPVDAVVYDRVRLKAGNLITGPAIVEEFDSTTVVPVGFQANVDAYGNLIMSRVSETEHTTDAKAPPS